MTHAFSHTLRPFGIGRGRAAETGHLYSLPVLAEDFPGVARLPVSLRIVLESVLRNCDGLKVLPEHVHQLAQWQPRGERTEEIPFTVAAPPSLPPNAPGSAAVRLGGGTDRPSPLEAWLSLLFGPSR